MLESEGVVEDVGFKTERKGRLEVSNVLTLEIMGGKPPKKGERKDGMDGGGREEKEAGRYRR